MYFCDVSLHEKYMKRCIQLAENGLGQTYPNPMVGSVIVHQDRIIGEGWHRKAGEAHAEVYAIDSVSDKHLLPEATIYVSLEPCSHFGKTPPCSDLIISSGIKKVVIGTIDPFTKVAGKGIRKLMDAGCDVVVGVLEDQCKILNKRFFSLLLKKRPYIILKWAESKDGFIAPVSSTERRPVWISNRYSRQLVHKWRAEEQGILIGTNTAVADDPKLNTRLWKGSDPVRVVLDRNLRIPENSVVLEDSIRTIVLCGKVSLEKVSPGKNGNLSYEAIDFGEGLAQQVCEVLAKNELHSVIVEGGRQTLQTFIDAGLWDEARIFIGTSRLKNGVEAPRLQGILLSEEKIASDILKIYTND